MRLVLIASFVFGLAGSPLVASASFDWPAPACKLKVESFEEYLESVQLTRLRFEGCLVMHADPPGRFYVDPKVPGDCSQQLYFKYEPEIKVQIRVYADKGETAFGVPQWNALLGTIYREEEGIEVKVVAPFSEDITGPPILGFISLKAEVRVTTIEDARTVVYQHFLVKPEEENLVVLISLLAPDKFTQNVYPLFNRFVRGMYQP